MPRRGSRAALVHLLAKEAALNWAFFDGRLLPPAAFYQSFDGYSCGHLRLLVTDSQLEPAKRGRPRRQWNDLLKEVNSRLKRMRRPSERSSG